MKMKLNFFFIIDDAATTFSTPNKNFSSDPLDHMVEQPIITKTIESTNEY